MFANIFPNTRRTQYFFKVHSESGRAFISNTQFVMNGLKNVEVLAEFKTDHNVISEFRRDASGGRRGGVTGREGRRRPSPFVDEKHPDHL